MSTLAEQNRTNLDTELSGLALSAVRILKKFLDSEVEPREFEMQQIKAAAPALSAWAKWEQTSTNRLVLQESITRRLADAPHALRSPGQEPVVNGKHMAEAEA